MWQANNNGPSGELCQEYTAISIKSRHLKCDETLFSITGNVPICHAPVGSFIRLRCKTIIVQKYVENRRSVELDNRQWMQLHCGAQLPSLYTILGITEQFVSKAVIAVVGETHDSAIFMPNKTWWMFRVAINVFAILRLYAGI